MSGFLEKLEAQLVDAAERNAAQAGAERVDVSAGEWAGVDPGAGTGRRWLRAFPARRRRSGAPSGKRRRRSTTSGTGQRRRPLRVIAFAASLLLGLAAVALAATGVLSTGASVKVARHPKPWSGLGIPKPGRARLIAHTVPDPEGGPSWSMRIVSTTRGYVCLQVGRLYNGRLGVLGEDGAFHDDGLFHPLPLNAFSHPNECHRRRVATEQEIWGMTASGQTPPGGKPGPLKQERRIYYGMLGPRAISVTYRVDGHLKTIPVERSTGAYLIVLPVKEPQPPVIEWGTVYGYPGEMQGRVSAVPPLTQIAYETSNGTCIEGNLQPVAHDPCPRKSTAAHASRGHERIRNLHVPIEARLQPMRPGSPGTRRREGAIDGVHYEALVSFKAPFAVDNAGSNYTLAQRIGCSMLVHDTRIKPYSPHASVSYGSLKRDVDKGSVVHVRDPNIFLSDECGAPMTIEVIYDNIYAAPGKRTVLLGRVKLKEP
ncbi:MAG TPA: hypothetical protein VGF95_11290 [Solirubrobacteraceae bacterium]|jgi:hypothetical protein